MPTTPAERISTRRLTNCRVRGTLTFNQVSAASVGSYTMTVYYVDGDAGRSAVITVNGTSTTVSFHGTNDTTSSL